MAKRKHRRARIGEYGDSLVNDGSDENVQAVELPEAANDGWDDDGEGERPGEGGRWNVSAVP